MYYAEKVIDGILCHRGTPDGDWVPFTLEQLTIELTAERVQSEGLRASWSDVCKKLISIRGILDSPA